MGELALKVGKSWDEIHAFADLILGSLCVTEHWDSLRERGAEMYVEMASLGVG